MDLPFVKKRPKGSFYLPKKLMFSSFYPIYTGEVIVNEEVLINGKKRRASWNRKKF
jgi:hypothetical protein